MKVSMRGSPLIAKPVQAGVQLGAGGCEVRVLKAAVAATKGAAVATAAAPTATATVALALWPLLPQLP